MDTRVKFVAIAEDDPDDVVLLKDAFEQCGWDVTLEFFANGSSLLSFLYKRGDYAGTGKLPHMILMDFHLPGTSGLDLISAIKSDPGLKRIPLIVLAGFCQDTDVNNCYDLGANTVIGKPSTFDSLLEAVKRICDYWFSVAGS